MDNLQDKKSGKALEMREHLMSRNAKVQLGYSDEDISFIEKFAEILNWSNDVEKNVFALTLLGS